MSDIFISYDHSDIKVAKALARAMEGCGWTVWWDRHITPGVAFDDVIEAELDASRCVVVLWSKSSTSSNWVKTEAADGSERGVLVPAMIEKTKIPLAFRRIQAADLTDWKENKSDPGFTDLVNAIAAILERPLSGEKSRTTEKMSRDEVKKVRAPASSRPNETIGLQTESQKIKKAATFNHSIVIHVPDPSKVEEERIPDDIVVEADNPALAIFGFSHGPLKWKDLKKIAIEQSNIQWLDELTRAVYRASHGRVFYPTESMYRSADGQVYRPILYQSQTFENGSMAFHILFVESRVMPYGVPRDLYILQSLLAQGIRFRYEIAENYLKIIDHIASSDIDKFCNRLRRSIVYLEEAPSFQPLIPEDIVQSFSSQEDKAKIIKIFEMYSMKREYLFSAIDARDINEIGSSLGELIEIFNSLTIAASHRYSEVVDMLIA
jgi:hypothetical protein